MRKEDFVIGKWYVSTKWSVFKAAKFSGFDIDGFFKRSEFIRISKDYVKENGRTVTDQKRWETFIEVPISEIAQYLPKDHPDLQDISIEYVKCISVYLGNKGNSIIGKIYPFNEINDFSEYKISNFSIKNAAKFIPATKEEYDAQFDSGLKEFPERGFCESISVDLYRYLTNRYPDANVNPRKDIIGYAWNSTTFWDISIGSGNTTYTIEQLNKFINAKTKENGKQQKTNSNPCGEIHLSTSENRRSIVSGTVTIRCRRQQISIGSRPEGNTTSASCGKTHIRTAKISKSVIIKETY